MVKIEKSKMTSPTPSSGNRDQTEMKEDSQDQVIPTASPNEQVAKPKKEKPEPTMDKIGFPVFGLATTGRSLFVVGGGGKSKTGIANGILCFEQDENSEWKLKSKCEIAEDLGAPMNIAFINESYLVAGIDDYCHVVKREKDGKLCLKSKFRSDFKVTKSPYDESYQKVVRSTREGSMICTGGTDCTPRLWDSHDIGSYFAPAEEVAVELKGHKQDINDLSFSDTGGYLATVSSEVVCLWTVDQGNKIRANLVTKLDTKLISKNSTFQFRFGCFGTGPSAPYFYTLSLDNRRRSFISRWRIGDFKLASHKMICDKPITAFLLSKCGNNFVFGTSEGGVGLVWASTLNKRWFVAAAHGFAVTSVVFTEDGESAVSGSADQSCRLWRLTSQDGVFTSRLMIFSILVFLISLLAGVWKNEIVEYFQMHLK
eukprot:Partr_v1_DN28683_c0_g1_i5_m50272 putative Prolactin regulatory element binding